MTSADEDYATGMPLELGDLLATTFRTIGANAASHLGLAAAVTIPSAAIGLVLQIVQHQLTQRALYGGSPEALLGAGAFGLGSLVVALLSFMVLVWGQGAMARIAVDRVRGRSLGARDALMATLPRYPALLGATFLVALATGVGSLLCLLPGIIAYLWLVVAVPAAACEEIGPLDALGRSIDLTEGSRLTIFLAALVVGLAFMALTFCILSPVMFSAVQSGIDPETLQDPLAPIQLFSSAMVTAVQMAWIVVSSVLNAVIYAKLRGLRDEVDARSVAEVFA